MSTVSGRWRLLKSQIKKVGLAPGTLVHVGEKKAESVRITYIDYDEKQFHEEQASRIEECFEFKKMPTVSWINIDGLHDVGLIDKLGAHYELHLSSSRTSSIQGSVRSTKTMSSVSLWY